MSDSGNICGTVSRSSAIDPSLRRVSRSKAIEALQDALSSFQNGDVARATMFREKAEVRVGYNGVRRILSVLCREIADEMAACAKIKDKADRCKSMSAHFATLQFFLPERAEMIMAEAFADHAAKMDNVNDRSRLYKLACYFAGRHHVVLKKFKDKKLVPTQHCMQRSLPKEEKFSDKAILVPIGQA